MSNILLYIIIISVTIYLVNITRFIIGINRPYKLSKNVDKIPISIIIAVKNGGDSVPTMLDNLLNQNYNGRMEFILVDDNSIDNTKKDILDYADKDSRVRYIHSSSGSKTLNHKKRALDAGIQSSKYEHLLFTDINCIIQLTWISAMAKCFTNNTNYIIGHSYVDANRTLLNKFQRLDFLMLLFASYGSVSINSPWACTGQNQAYTKTLYKDIGGFEPLNQYLQGDDTLFLQLAIKKGANIIFNNYPQSYVISRTEEKWCDLFLQRARWSGDANLMWKFNFLFYLAALASFNINFIIIALVFTPWVKIGLVILIFKLLFELIMYISGMKKIQHENSNYIDFIFWSLITPFYTVTMGIVSFFNISWKGKKL